MSDSPHATARAVVVQNSPSAAKNTNENSTPPKLDSSPFGDVDNSWVIMTTDGGNDTEPEEEIQEDVVSWDVLERAALYKLLTFHSGSRREAQEGQQNFT